MPPLESLKKLRQVITENLRVQRAGAEPIQYIDVTHALDDVKARQNHVIFGRRGCGKTLLLQNGDSSAGPDRKTIYLNCEDFKNHSFPNVLIEILDAVFSEMESRLTGWFGKKKRSRELIREIRSRLVAMQQADDQRTEKVVQKESSGTSASIQAGTKSEANVEAKTSIGKKAAGAEASTLSKLSSGFSLSGDYATSRAQAIERAYERADSKIRDLNMLLPKLKARLKDFFELSTNIKVLFLQIDDFYHLEREHQPFVMDYVHRLCKDLPLYFKAATLRHASVLYAERKGQPVGAQERHDYQPIDIDFTFQDFPKTEKQVLDIFHEFAQLADITPSEFDSLFKGDGFRRLVLAGGGVPRDCLSLFLEALGPVMADNSRIGKDDVRLLSFSNFERKIEDLKRDSQAGEQDVLLKGIYVIRQFCLQSKSSVFFVPDRLLQQLEPARELIFRLLDYRIVHSVGTAFTHKSHSGSYQGFMVDIGCYAHMRKLAGKMNEIDLSSAGAKEQMRSVPILSQELLQRLWSSAPRQVTTDDLIKEPEA
jgi:energy-coupling factor transporter ATP-binding protein EcfA2